MDTVSIFKILTRMTRGIKCFATVVPCDQLKNIPIRVFPMFIVANSKPSTHPGEHWLAIHVKSSKGPVTFFDSFGFGVTFYSADFSEFFKRLGGGIIENTKPLQSLGSDCCGQYALYFLNMKINGCCTMSTYCHFSSNRTSNDKKVRRFFNKNKHLLRTSCRINNLIKQCCTKF